MRLVDCGHGVWIGDAAGCDARGRQFATVLHGWRPENIADGQICRCLRDSAGWGIPVQLVEGAPVETWDKSLDWLAGYLRGSAPLLAHGAGGSCRGPTLGLLALVCRGVDPAAACRHIIDAMWGQIGACPDLHAVPLEGIFRWASLSNDRLGSTP